MNETMSNNPLAILDSMRNGAVVRQRLRWIENRLWWVGEVNRSDLVIRFGISPPQATNDFALYQKLAPTNIRYDRKKKLYACGAEFLHLFPKDHELWLKDSQNEDLSLKSIQMVTVTSLKRGIDPMMVRIISKAVRSCVPLRITYQSMKADEPEERIVSPHAIVETEVRWHVRAWDEKRQTFLDLVPSRIIKAKSEPSATWMSQENDEDWNRIVEIILTPSGKLSENQRRIADSDYQMNEGRRILQVRACLVYYQLSAMYLVDAVRYHQGQPKERDFGVAVENWKELQPLVMEMI
jgi:hypothetical protein